MNHVIFMGRLTRDPEIRTSRGENPTTVARFSIAVDRRFRRDGDPSADFFNVTAFGRLGDFTDKYLKKGTKIVLQGHIQNDNYTNRHGEKVYTTQVIAEEIEFAESRKAAEENAGQTDRTRGGSRREPEADEEGFMDANDLGELPFS